MNPDQVVGTIRQFLPFVSGIALALGLTWFDGVASAVLNVIGPVTALVSLVWSLIDKTKASTIAKVATMSGVKSIALEDNNAGRALAPVTPLNVNVAVTPSPIR